MTSFEEWLSTHDPKYHDQASELFARITKLVPGTTPEIEPDGMVGFGKGVDDFFLLCFTVRKDGFRLYANVGELSRHREELGRRLTGKSWVTIKAVSDVDHELLAAIVKGSLAATSMTAE